MYSGRKPVTLDVSYEDFMTNPVAYIQKYFNKVLRIHKSNVVEIEHLEDLFRGQQAILSKTRSDSTNGINNIIVENHIQNIVNFKVGFTVGNPIEYSNTSAIETHDMDYFTNYLNDCKKSALDIEKYTDLYKYGVANRMIIYRVDDFDTEWQAPFRVINLPVDNSFVVRESGVLKRVLFSVIISKRITLESDKQETIYTIYLENGVFEMNKSLEITMPMTTQDFGGKNPIIEYEANPARMGLIEIIESLQDAVNQQDSLQLDDIEEFVNYYIVFKNQNFEDEEFEKKFKKWKKDRVLLLKSNNPQMQADVQLLKNSLDHTDLGNLYGRFVEAMYNVLAVPLSSGNVTSGGDTGAARLLGNGWETAQNRAEMETTWLDKFEYEELSRMFTMSKEVSNAKMRDLNPSDISITYKINMSDNLYLKAESLQMLYGMNFPKEIALNVCKITSDSHGVAEKWETKDQEVKAQTQAQEEQKTQVDNDNSTNKPLEEE